MLTPVVPQADKLCQIILVPKKYLLCINSSQIGLYRSTLCYALNNPWNIILNVGYPEPVYYPSFKDFHSKELNAFEFSNHIEITFSKSYVKMKEKWRIYLPNTNNTIAEALETDEWKWKQKHTHIYCLDKLQRFLLPCRMQLTSWLDASWPCQSCSMQILCP